MSGALVLITALAASTTGSTAVDLGVQSSTAALRMAPPIETSSVAKQSEPVDAFRYAKYAAVIDGGWSILMTVAWALSARSWQAPYPEGILGISVARVLYGTTWTVQVALNTALLRIATGEEFEGISQGALRNHWLIGLDIPAPCENGGGGFCGVGLGGYSEISVTIDRDEADETALELAMTGGWIQGRFDTDERRTLMESTWVQAPFIARARWRRSLGPITFETVLGAGLYYGMHNAHVHETNATRGELDVPPWEIVVLEAGAGLGAHAKFALDFFDTITIEAEGDLAPFPLAVRPGRPDVVGQLDNGRRGELVWRRAAVGIGLSRGVLPVRLAVRAFGLDLGGGPIETLGHKGVILQFDTPFDLEDEEEDEPEE